MNVIIYAVIKNIYTNEFFTNKTTLEIKKIVL